MYQANNPYSSFLLPLCPVILQKFLLIPMQSPFLQYSRNCATIVTTNMAAMHYFSRANYCFLYSQRRLHLLYVSVNTLMENKWPIQQIKPIPTSGCMHGSCFEFCYTIARFYMWVTSSEPGCIHFNSSSTSPLGNRCQSLRAHASVGGIDSYKDLSGGVETKQEVFLTSLHSQTMTDGVLVTTILDHKYCRKCTKITCVGSWVNLEWGLEVIYYWLHLTFLSIASLYCVVFLFWPLYKTYFRQHPKIYC